MFPGESKERLTHEEIGARYQDAFSRIKKLYGFSETEQDIERIIQLQDGYRIFAEYNPTTRMQVRVTCMSDKVLSFVMRDTGLESLAFMAPSLVLGGQEVKLGSFGIGLEGSLTAVDYELGKSDNMDILGIQLVDWIERSVNEYRLLKPLDIRVKLPLLPQES